MANEPSSSAHSKPGQSAAAVQFVCPACEEEFLYQFQHDANEPPACCPGCQLDFGVCTPPPRPGQPFEKCWVCGNEEFYIQKDFNRQFGLRIVLTSFLIIFLIMLEWGHRVGIYFLVCLAVVDWLFYRKLRNATVCYLCQSVYRGVALNPAHRGFYLGSEEKYKRLRKEWLKSLQKTP